MRYGVLQPSNDQVIEFENENTKQEKKIEKSYL